MMAKCDGQPLFPHLKFLRTISLAWDGSLLRQARSQSFPAGKWQSKEGVRWTDMQR